MPLYDCGSPDCDECQRAFGPDRSNAIAAGIASGKFASPPLPSPDLVRACRDRMIAAGTAPSRAYDNLPSNGFGYCNQANHPDREKWNPFEPDAIGALREALAWMQAPQISGDGVAIYSAHNLYRITEMMRLAVRRADQPVAAKDAA